MFKVNSKEITGYIIHKVTDLKALVCKILKECPNENETIKNL